MCHHLLGSDTMYQLETKKKLKVYLKFKVFNVLYELTQTLSK